MKVEDMRRWAERSQRWLFLTQLSSLCFDFLCNHSNERVEQTIQAWRKTWKKSLITGSLLFTALRISFSIHCSASSSLTTIYAEIDILYFPSGTSLRRTAYLGRSRSRRFHCLVAAQIERRTACGFSESRDSIPARFPRSTWSWDAFRLLTRWNTPS